MENKKIHTVSEEELRTLLYLIARDDAPAFTKLLRLFWSKVYVQALTILKSSEDAQELTQDIFMQIWEGRSKLPDIQSFQNYLFIVSRNRVLSALRKKGAAPMGLSEQVQEDLYLPAMQLEHKELFERIMSAIESMPARRKQVFLMSRMENKTYEEIAAALGIGRETVKEHMILALNYLREIFRFEIKDMILLLIFLSIYFFKQ